MTISRLASGAISATASNCRRYVSASSWVHATPTRCGGIEPSARAASPRGCNRQLRAVQGHNQRLDGQAALQRRHVGPSAGFARSVDAVRRRAREEDGFVTVVPLDAVVLVLRFAVHFENPPVARGLADFRAVDDDLVTCYSMHSIFLLVLTVVARRPRSRRRARRAYSGSVAEVGWILIQLDYEGFLER